MQSVLLYSEGLLIAKIALLAVLVIIWIVRLANRNK